VPRRPPAPRPENLDGAWVTDPEPGQHGYEVHRHGPALVRYHPGYEPDGELVMRDIVSAHMERMDKGAWFLALDFADGHRVCVDLNSKSRIHVRWRAE
jgi:hypothetical protein